MTYTPANPNGQAAMANSTPVVLASDQTALTTKLSDGTNMVGVLVPGTPNATVNAVPIAATTLSETFSVTSVSNGPTYDVGNYRWVSVHIVTQYAGGSPVISFQISNDGVNFSSITLIAANSGVVTAVGSTTGTGVWHGGLAARYFRLTFSGTYVSGAATGTILFSSQPGGVTTMAVNAAQNGTWGLTKAAGSTAGLNNASINANLGAAVSAVSKTSTGTVFVARCESIDGTLVYLQLFMSATIPAAGAVPLLSFAVPVGSATAPGVLQVDESFFGTAGRSFSAGIAWGVSTTKATYTATTTASNYNVTIVYI